MDANGLPISMCLTEGNRSEQTTVIDTEKKMIRSFRSKEVIYCADAGLGSYDIREFNNKGNRKFIVTQSVKKLSKQLQDNNGNIIFLKMGNLKFPNLGGLIFLFL